MTTVAEQIYSLERFPEVQLYQKFVTYLEVHDRCPRWPHRCPQLLNTIPEREKPFNNVSKRNMGTEIDILTESGVMLP